MKEVGHVPARGGSARTAHIVCVNVRIDDGRRTRLELGEKFVVTLEVPARIYHNRVTVAHEHVAERALADAIELDHV